MSGETSRRKALLRFAAFSSGDGVQPSFLAAVGFTDIPDFSQFSLRKWRFFSSGVLPHTGTVVVAVAPL